MLANADESRYLNVGRNHPPAGDDTLPISDLGAFALGDKMILSFEYKKGNV